MDPHAKRNTMSIDDVLDDVWRGAKKKRRRHAGAKPAAPAATDADAASAAARRLRADAHLRHAEEKREIAILLARPPRAFPAPDAPPPPRAAEAQMRDDDAAQMQDAATGDGAAAAQDDGATGDDGAAEDDGAARDGAVSDEGPAALPGGGAPSPPLGGCASSPERGDCGAAELASREGSPERGDPAAEPSPKRQKCPADDGVARCGTDDAIGALRRLRDEAPPRDSLDGFALPDSLSRGAALPAAPAAPAARRSDAAGAVPRPQGSVPKDDSHGLPKDCSHGSVATDCSVPTEFEHGGGPTPFSQPYSAREAPRASAPCISQVLSGAWTTQASRSQASLLGVDDRDDEAPFESPAVVVEAWDARRRAVVLGLFADERDAHRDEVLRIAKMMASRESTLRLASQAATIGVARGLLERPPQPRTRRVRSDAAEGAAGVAVSAAAAAAAESATGDGAVMKKPVARSATAVDAAPPRRPVARAATTDAAPPRPPAAERIPAEKGALPAAKVPLVKALFVKKPVKKFGTKAAVPAPAARPAALFAGVNAVLVYKRTSKVAVANVGRKFAAQGGRLLGVFSADGDGCAGEVGEALKNGATHVNRGAGDWETRPRRRQDAGEGRLRRVCQKCGPLKVPPRRVAKGVERGNAPYPNAPFPNAPQIVVDAADCFDASAESSGDFEEEDGCKTPAEVVLNHAATGASIEVLRLNWLTSSLGEQRLLAAQHFVVSVPPPAKKKRASLVAAKKCTSRADYVQSQAGKKLFACQILPQGARPDDAWKAERSAADGALDGADGAWNGAPAEGAAAKAGNANIIDWLTELVLFYNGPCGAVSEEECVEEDVSAPV
ncbi:hypothetical protein M885DRAFT_43053 [Pelagophyceae sp. CCMP2097]|nr:hypothetical protein M885DRAFT_43053 [Pelagophyceae sp. CCMP2097]